MKSQYALWVVVGGLALVVVTGAPVLGVLALVGVLLADHFTGSKPK